MSTKEVISMDKILKIALKEAIIKRKKELRSAEVWHKQDVESLRLHQNLVADKSGEVNKLKGEIFTLEELLRG